MCYELGCWRCYILSVKMFRTMLCNDFYYFTGSFETWKITYYVSMKMLSKVVAYVLFLSVTSAGKLLVGR